MDRFLRETLPNGYFVDVPLPQTKRMRAIRYKDNKSTERRFRLALVRAGLSSWKLHPSGLAGKPDFFFPDANLVIFVDGCFWHGCPQCSHAIRKNSAYWLGKIGKNQERDRTAAEMLRQCGFTVERFWEHELHENLRGCVDKIKTLVEPSREGRSVTCE